MSWASVFRVLRRGLRIARRHLPTILTVTAGAGAVGSVVTAVKATPKAMKQLDAKRERVAIEKDIPVEKVVLTPKEVIATCGKNYIVPGGLLIASLICMGSATHLGAKKAAALAGLLTLSENKRTAIENKLEEVVGKSKAEQIRKEATAEVAKKELARAEVLPTGQAVPRCGGDTLCIDELSMRTFYCDIERLRAIQNDFNRELIYEMSATLNELYDRIGLKHTLLGDECGWNVDHMLEFDFSSTTKDDAGRPCLVVGYMTPPKADYINIY